MEQGFLHTGWLSCHPTISVKALKGIKYKNPKQKELITKKRLFDQYIRSGARNSLAVPFQPPHNIRALKEIQSTDPNH